MDVAGEPGRQPNAHDRHGLVQASRQAMDRVQRLLDQSSTRIDTSLRRVETSRSSLTRSHPVRRPSP